MNTNNKNQFNLVMKKKVFTSAPLPFMGQKRRFIKEFKNALSQYPKDATYVDLFGGSGLLSHTVKAQYPDATVIYNDFDNFSERLLNIDKTNALLGEIRAVLKNYPKDVRIEGAERETVLQLIKKADEKGFVDYITLSSSVLFAMNHAHNFEQLSKEKLYNCVRQADYKVDGYLNGLQIVSTDYKNLFNQYKNTPNVVFLVDPPYLSTDVGNYKGYWKLKDYLDVLQVLQGTKYFYFTSNKSNIIELCDWVSTFTPFNPFAEATQVTTAGSANFQSTYTDIMMFK